MYELQNSQKFCHLKISPYTVQQMLVLFVLLKSINLMLLKLTS